MIGGGVGTTAVIQGVAVLVGMFGLGFVLKLAGAVGEDMAPKLARIVTDLLIPAIVFHSLVRHGVDLTELEAPALFALAEGVVLLLAWLLGRALRLERAKLGAFMLASAFGSSTLLGYGFAAEVYGGSARAMLDAVLVSELGVGLPIFVVGVAVAIGFGQGGKGGTLRGALLGYLGSPIFLATAAGLLWPVLGLPTSGFVMETVLRIAALFGEGLTAMAAVIVGLMLKRVALAALLLPALGALVLKLAVEPALAAGGALVAGIGGMEQQILVLMAAMPSATLAAVFSARYGCDGALATALVVTTTVGSALSVVVAFALLT